MAFERDDVAVRPTAGTNQYNPMLTSPAGKRLYETGTPEQIKAVVDSARRTTGGFGMGFFDDIISAAGSVASTIGNVVRQLPTPVQQLIPFGSTIAQVGGLASGGLPGLAGVLAQQGQTYAGPAASILGVPALGGIFNQVIGAGGRALGLPGFPSNGPFLPTVPSFTGGGMPPGVFGSGGGGASRTIGAPMLSPLNPSLLNQRNILPTSLTLRDPLPTLGGLTPTNANGCPMSVGQFRAGLLRQASQAAGFRITWKKLLYILLHFGIEIAKRLTQLDEPAILWLYTTRPHRGRRGPHLNTIAKRARQVQSYRHRIARISRILGAGRHTRAASAAPRRRKGRR
jgi:hypothetical protein